MVSKNYALQSLLPASRILHPRAAFTLVELLVVITIIGILASLITVAAIGALKRAREVEIKAELNQIDTGLMDYKNKFTAFPPNCQTDDQNLTAEPATSNTPLDEGQVFNDLKRHMKQAFPRHQESEDLLRVICGLLAIDQTRYPVHLAGGMSAGEAVVFWLGGFSSDPKYPVSGEGGPAYPIRDRDKPENRTLDPIESRAWVFPFDIARLGPRGDDDSYFNGRFIEYTATINGVNQLRRINFWQYLPRKSEQPYLYFDTSRHSPTAGLDPPAATQISGLGPDGNGLHVHAFKKKVDSAATAAATMLPIQFVDPEKFQILHCGLDEAWDEESFERMSYHGVQSEGGDPTKLEDYLVYPTGPFAGECADTITNFASETKIEDAAE